MIELLTADIEKYTSDAATLAKEIAALESTIAANTGDIKAATKVREIEKAQYDKEHKDYVSAVTEFASSIKTMESEAHDRAQASFVQLSTKTLDLIPEDAKRSINAFLSTDADLADGLAVEQPATNAYEFQGQGEIEMFEKLEGKFEDELTKLEKEEMKSKHAFDMLITDLNAHITQMTNARDEKAEAKTANLQSKATAEDSKPPVK